MQPDETPCPLDRSYCVFASCDESICRDPSHSCGFPSCRVHRPPPEYSETDQNSRMPILLEDDEEIIGDIYPESDEAAASDVTTEESNDIYDDDREPVVRGDLQEWSEFIKERMKRHVDEVVQLKARTEDAEGRAEAVSKLLIQERAAREDACTFLMEKIKELEGLVEEFVGAGAGAE